VNDHLRGFFGGKQHKNSANSAIFWLTVPVAGLLLHASGQTNHLFNNDLLHPL
jgi:hypothetical protein